MHSLTLAARSGPHAGLAAKTLDAEPPQTAVAAQFIDFGYEVPDHMMALLLKP